MSGLIFSRKPIYITYFVLHFLLLSDHDNQSKHVQIYGLVHATSIGRVGLKYENYIKEITLNLLNFQG